MGTILAECTIYTLTDSSDHCLCSAPKMFDILVKMLYTRTRVTIIYHHLTILSPPIYKAGDFLTFTKTCSQVCILRWLLDDILKKNAKKMKKRYFHGTNY